MRFGELYKKLIIVQDEISAVGLDGGGGWTDMLDLGNPGDFGVD